MSDTHSSSISPDDTSPSSASIRPHCILVSKEVLSKVPRNFACRNCLSTKLKSAAQFSGFDMEWTITCETCSDVVVMQELLTKSKQKGEKYVLTLMNIFLVHISILNGLGMMGMNSLCWALNFKKFDVKFYSKYVTFVKEALLSTARILCKDAIKSVFVSYRNEGIKPDSNGILDIAVSYDEVKHSAGDSTSLIGALTEVNTGLIVDFEVVHKKCETCKEEEAKLKEMKVSTKEFNAWKQTHYRSGCPLSKEYIEDRMEVVERMWQRSVEKNLRYTVLVGKTLRDIQLLDIMKRNGGPYEGHSVCRQDFPMYMAKKMTSALLKVREETKNKKRRGQLNRNCELSNKNIDILVASYERAIRDGKHKDVKSMRESVLANYYHYASTDKHPKHMFCKSVDCIYVRDQGKNSKLPAHKNMHITFGKDKHLRKKIFDIYARFSSRKLIKRCLREVCSKNKSWVSKINSQQQNMKTVEGEAICRGIWAINISNRKALKLEQISISKDSATTSSLQLAASPKKMNSDLQLECEPEAKKRKVESDQLVVQEEVASTSNTVWLTTTEEDAEEHDFYCEWFIPVKTENFESFDEKMGFNDIEIMKEEIEDDLTIKQENDERDVLTEEDIPVEVTDEFYG